MSSHYAQLADWSNAMTEFVMVYRNIPAGKRSEPIDGGWSARQLVEHLHETEILFSTRMRAAIAQPGSTLAAWDPDAYVDNVPNSAVPDELLLDSLAALRSVNLSILRALPDDAWSWTVEHPENGTQSLEKIVTIFGNHVTEHLNDMKNAGSWACAHFNGTLRATVCPESPIGLVGDLEWSSYDSKLAEWDDSVAEFVAVYRQIPMDRRTESIDGGWSAREVLQHLLEDEILFATRVRAAIADPGSTILPLDPERYQANLSYALVPDDVLLESLAALRAVNVGLLRALPGDAWGRTVRHPEAGDQSVESIATVFGDHVSDHLSDVKNAGLGTATR